MQYAVKAAARQRQFRIKILLSLLSAEVFETLRVEWRNSTAGFCLGARAKKSKY